MVEAARPQRDLSGHGNHDQVERHACQGADEGGGPDLQGRGAGDLLGRGPDEAQRREALGPLRRPQIRDDPDEQQRGYEHRDGADDRGDPIRLVLVEDALEGGDHLGRDVELGGGHGPQVRPDDGHQRIRSLDGLGGQDPYLLAVAVAELVGGQGRDARGQGRRGQVLAPLGDDVGSWDLHRGGARLRQGHLQNRDRLSAHRVEAAGDGQLVTGQDVVGLEVRVVRLLGGAGQEGDGGPAGAHAALGEGLGGGQQHEEQRHPHHDSGDDPGQAAPGGAVVGDEQPGQGDAAHDRPLSLPGLPGSACPGRLGPAAVCVAPGLMRPSRTVTSRSA